MSINVMSILGVTVTCSDKTFTTVSRKKSCNHKFNHNKSNFCPTCGNKVTINLISAGNLQFSTLSELADFINDEFEYDADHKYQCYICPKHENLQLIVGYGVCNKVTYQANSSINYENIPSIDNIKTSIEKILKPLNLYNKTTFGLYQIIDNN